MQQIRGLEGQPVGQYTPDIKVQAGADEAPECSLVVERDSQPESGGGMDDQVMGDAEGGDQQDQYGNEDGIPIHPPVVQEEDEGEEYV